MSKAIAGLGIDWCLPSRLLSSINTLPRHLTYGKLSRTIFHSSTHMSSTAFTGPPIGPGSIFATILPHAARRV